uniref:ATP synthase F0 subunit 8 n=1 Tax=Siboglinum ekmani TaxID=167800 RepID=A0A0E3DQW7_9ANNE|nr:ATP synthase F0 subunit 8 [Siboglinum ekmani]
MPHLAPMNWLMISILIYLCFFFILSIMWWMQTPMMPSTTLKYPPQLYKWKW